MSAPEWAYSPSGNGALMRSLAEILKTAPTGALRQERNMDRHSPVPLRGWPQQTGRAPAACATCAVIYPPGIAPAHCEQCHESFASRSAFVKHKVAGQWNSQCDSFMDSRLANGTDNVWRLR